jgi:hypothetical protein
MEHYCCYTIHNEKTNAERSLETVEFFPSKIPMPKLSSADAAIRAAKDLIHALQKPHPAAPFSQLGNPQMEALNELAGIFYDALPRVEEKKPHQAVPRVEKQSETRPTPPGDQQQAPGGMRTRSKTQNSKPATPHPYFTNLAETITLAKVRATTEDWIPMAAAVVDPTTGRTMEYKELITNPTTKSDWLISSANEFGRLAQGVGGRIKGTNTIFFIHKHEVPEERRRDVTYGRFVCDFRPQKSEPNRTRLTVGGNLTFKCHVNHT